MNNPNAEVEPWIANNPRLSRNVVATWQQDRWNDGGAKGLVAGSSFNGGATWSEVPLPFSQCAAPFYERVAPFDRASDPWDSVGPDGKTYGQRLVFNANDTHNGVAAVASADGGRTWQNLRLLIDDPASDPTQPGDDKNSVTADPALAGSAYAVWDRIVLTTCGSAIRRVNPQIDDHPALRGPSGALNCFTGPSYFSRTTNGGLTWEPARPIVPAAINEQTIGNQIVVNHRTGVLFDFFDYITADGVFHAQMVFSRDQGLTWSRRQAIADIASAALQANRGASSTPGPAPHCVPVTSSRSRPSTRRAGASTSSGRMPASTPAGTTRSSSPRPPTPWAEVGRGRRPSWSARPATPPPSTPT
ncbi:MAG: glycoside hydrolase [Chloroflexota bacterium]|nr:glycoside hydrolase [Chloroflexota bacterium]